MIHNINCPCLECNRINFRRRFLWMAIASAVFLLCGITIGTVGLTKKLNYMKAAVTNTIEELLFSDISDLSGSIHDTPPADDVTVKKLKDEMDGLTVEILKKLKKDIGELRAEIDGNLLEGPEDDLEPKLYDFALKRNGAEIERIDGECGMNMRNYILSLFGETEAENMPDQMIDTYLLSGKCYRFKNTPCSVTIKLAYKADIKSIAIGHIIPADLPSEEKTSAPKDFNFYGLNEPFEKNEVLINSYSYDIHLLKPFQYFDVVSPGKSFTHVKFEFLSNHGNENYTCVYRVCVFGIKA